jgi:hypothetical protein
VLDADKFASYTCHEVLDELSSDVSNADELAAYLAFRKQTADQAKQEMIQLLALDMMEDIDEDEKAENPHWAQKVRDDAKAEIDSDKALRHQLEDRMTEEERLEALLLATKCTRQDVEASMLKKQHDEYQQYSEKLKQQNAATAGGSTN